MSPPCGPLSTRFSLTLPQRQARLAYLALTYHLGRPGSEIDPVTLKQGRRGLSEVGPVLEKQLGEEEAALELTPFQMTLLGSALLGALNELKLYSLLDTMAAKSERSRSTVPGFEIALLRLFPALAADPALAFDLAEEVMLLRRELAPTIDRAQELLRDEKEAAEETKRRRRSRWQFWRR